MTQLVKVLGRREVDRAGAALRSVGVRGHMDAFDIDTGRRVWRTYTEPEPGEAGSETWPLGGQAWARGGGSVWVIRNWT